MLSTSKFIDTWLNEIIEIGLDSIEVIYNYCGVYEINP